jgi:hypothetical protein
MKMTEAEKQAWVDGYCAAAIAAALPINHPRRKQLIARFWQWFEAMA